MSAHPLPVVLCIDAEPDYRFLSVAEPPRWRGQEFSVDWLRRLRERLERVTRSPVHFSWYLRLDPQMERVCGVDMWPPARDRWLDEVIGAGDAIGVHPHLYRWSDAAGAWVTDNGDAQWVAHCVQAALDNFAAAFGHKARLVRLGDRFMSEAVMAQLEAAEVEIDLSVEPGFRQANLSHGVTRYSGPMPDTRRVPRRPYRPLRGDFRKPATAGARALWVMPISVGRVWRRPRRRQLRLRKTAALNLASEPAVVDAVLRQNLRSGTSPLVAALRSGDAGSDPQRSWMQENTQRLVYYAERQRMVFRTPHEALADGVPH